MQMDNRPGCCAARIVQTWQDPESEKELFAHRMVLRQLQEGRKHRTALFGSSTVASANASPAGSRFSGDAFPSLSEVKKRFPNHSFDNIFLFFYISCVKNRFTMMVIRSKGLVPSPSM